MSNKRFALATVTIGGKTESIARLTHPVMRQYAMRLGADFVVIDKQRVNNREPKFEKFQLYELLETYERVVYLDTDILVMPTCKSLLDIVPSYMFGAFFDSEVKDNDADIPEWREEEIEHFQRKHGDIGWTKTYFNSGVMVVHRRHREIFKHDTQLHPGKRVVDQTQINYRLQQLKYPAFDIGPRYNYFVALSASARQFDERFHSEILHYAGYEYFYSRPSLEERIREDLATIYELNRGA